MSEKSKKKPPSGKGKGNQKTKRRKKMKQKQAQQAEALNIEESSSDAVSSDQDRDELEEQMSSSEEASGQDPIMDQESEDISANQLDITSDVEQVDESTEDVSDQVSDQDHEPHIEEIHPIPEAESLSPEELDPQNVPVVEDETRSRIGQRIKDRFSSYMPPLDMRKQLLPDEMVLSSKLVIYFSEGQIFLGLFLTLLGILTMFLMELLILSLMVVFGGLVLVLTGYASEEIHITDYRILVRRMNWIDRLFRIPKDSQYILDEIVSFDIQRAPMNLALFIAGVLPSILFVFPVVRSSGVLIFVLIVFMGFLLILSQRLSKRVISFSMSGGHEVNLGVYKGIPVSVVDTFIDIVMEKNVFQSDEY